MRTEQISTGGAGRWLIGLAVLWMGVVTGCADAQTFTSGGSTTVIEQSGGSRRVESQVTGDRGGQAIVTQDGRSTDVTIQREAGAASGVDGAHVGRQAERFDRPSSRAGYRSRFPATPGGTDADAGTSPHTRDALKARILDRMRTVW